MALTNAGRNFIAQAIINDSIPTFFDNSNAFLCIGDSSTAFAATQTDLQAETNKIRKAMDAGYPTRTDNSITFKGTCASGEGNWTWNEWGIANASTGGVLLNRVVENLVTKVSGVCSLTVTLEVTTS